MSIDPTHIPDVPTNAAAGFIAGLANCLEVAEIHGVPHLMNSLSGTAQSLEHLLPAPPRQTTKRTLRTMEDFCDYVKRFKKTDSSIYVTSGSAGQFLLVAELDHRSATGTAWSDHVVTLSLEPSESLTRWRSGNKRRLSQEEFADLLEESTQDIVTPAAGELLDIARELHVTRNMSVKSCVRSKPGENSITYNLADGMKAGASGTVELPTEFTLRIEPFARNRNSATVRALLRPKIADDKPTFLYDLQLLDEAIEEVLATILGAIRTQTGLPVYR